MICWRRRKLKNSPLNLRKQIHIPIPDKSNRSRWLDVVVVNEEKIRCCSCLQRATKVCLLIGQCCGLFPCLGVTSIHASELRFSAVSWRAGYALLSLLGQVFFFVMCVYRFYKEQWEIEAAVSVVFHGITFLAAAILFQLAMRWPGLCTSIARLEAMDLCLDSKLYRRCNLTCVTMLLVATFEHSLYVIAGVSKVMDCSPDEPIFKAFCLDSVPWIFNYFPYSLTLCVISKLVSLQSTINWSYIDVFVVCLSLYLVSRFKEVNRRVRAAKGKILPASWWRVVRQSYGRVSQMVREVDVVLGSLVLLSFANNLFFICLQLFHAFSEGVEGIPVCGRGTSVFGGFEQSAYFLVSFVFLLLRSALVMLVASSVHVEARAPAPALFAVPSAGYCLEVERFIDQVFGDGVALTGLQFFDVTRSVMLTVVGSVVTYELVLVQLDFDGPPKDPTRAPAVPPNFTQASTPSYS